VGFIHLAKTSSASILGTYCQIIADTLKSHLGKDNIVYDWEGGELCSRLAHPFGVVQVNLCFIYVGMSVAFWCALLHAYHIGKTPIIIHAVGYIIWVIFAIKASWYNTLKFRNTYIRKYMANKNIQRTGQNAADDV
ncbi:MAG: hypothetical protein L7F78_06590, partial [Syntrophales bacterium LBB04]|nr:hypothetical protein [Syntrophales bacterium LBB04]